MFSKLYGSGSVAGRYLALSIGCHEVAIEVINFLACPRGVNLQLDAGHGRGVADGGAVSGRAGFDEVLGVDACG